MTAGVLVTSAVALAWLGLAFLRTPTKALGPFTVILAAPLFIKLTRQGVELGDAVVSHGGGQTVPLSLFALALVLFVAAPRLALSGLRLPRSPQSRLLAGFWAVNVFAFAIGFLQQPKVGNLLFLAQTLVPSFCFFIALKWVRGAVTARRLVAILAGIVSASVFLEIVFDVVTAGALETFRGGVSGYIWWLPVYGALDYFPLVVVAAYGLGLCLFLGEAGGRRRLAWGLASAVTLCALLVLHSKGAMFTALLLTVTELALFSRETAVRRRRVAAFVLVVAFIGAGVALGPEGSTVQNIKDFVTSGAGDESSRTRFISLEIASAIILNNPLIGSGYVAAIDDDWTGIARIANPHNQYLTYGVRAGLPALLIFVGFLATSSWRLWRLVNSRQPRNVRALAIGLFSVVTAVTAISNLLQDNFTQPYSGCILWFLLGVAERLCIMPLVTPVTAAPLGAIQRSGSPVPRSDHPVNSREQVIL